MGFSGERGEGDGFGELGELRFGDVVRERRIDEVVVGGGIKGELCSCLIERWRRIGARRKVRDG